MITLPPLTGRAGKVVRAIYMILLPIGLVLTVSGLIFFYHVTLQIDPLTSRYGVALALNDDLRPIVANPGDGPLPAGLTPGDRVVAIDGRPMGRIDFARIAHVFDAGKAVIVLDVAQPDGHVTRHHLRRIIDGTGAAPSDQPVPVSEVERNELALRTITNFILFLVSFLLFRRKSSDPESMIFTFGFLLWAMQPAGMAQGTAHALGIPIGHWRYMFRSAHAIGVMLVTIGLPGFPNGRFPNRIALLGLLPAVAYVAIGVPTDFAFFDRHLAIRSAMYFIIWAAAASPVLLRYPRLPQGIERQQIKWAAFGAATLIACSVLRLGVDSLPWTATPAVYYLGLALLLGESLAFPVGLLISLLRFRLYAADSVIGRSAGYGGLTLLFVALTAGFEQVAQAISQDFLGDSLGGWAGGIGAAAAAASITPLHNRIMHWSERHSQTRLRQLRDGLPRLLTDLRHTATPNTIAQTALDRIMIGLGPERGAVIREEQVLAESEITNSDIISWLASHSADLRRVDKLDRVFPIRLPLVAEHGGADGWLLLGTRADGSVFSHDEREALDEVADALARALSMAAERRELEAQRVSEVDTLKDHIAGLREELAQLRSSLTGPTSNPE